MIQQIPWPEIYERELVPAIFKPWSVVTIVGAMPEPGEHVLDVACGTGIVARNVATYVGPQGKVIGLDINADMLACARSLEVPSGVPIEWVEGDALRLPFAEALFDIVLCQGGLQFITDRSTALREMYRVLKPGGRVAILLFDDLQSSTAFGILARTIEAYVDPVVVEHIMAPFSLDDRHEAWGLLEHAGFQKIFLREITQTVRFHSAEHFVRARLAGSRIRNSMSQPILERAIREGSEALQPYEFQGKLSFPMVGYLIRGVKE